MTSQDLPIFSHTQLFSELIHQILALSVQCSHITLTVSSKSFESIFSAPTFSSKWRLSSELEPAVLVSKAVCFNNSHWAIKVCASIYLCVKSGAYLTHAAVASLKINVLL